MLTIRKRFAFSASHQLSHLPPEHPCARLHGHNYEVEFVLCASAPNEQTGFVQDYRELDIVKQYLDDRLDHRHLNDVFGDSRKTTAEALATTLFERFKSSIPLLVAVAVSETPKTWAEYAP